MTAIAARLDRSTVAGLGASGALMATVGVAAAFLVAVVAFDAWPTSDGDEANALTVQPAAAAPSRAAAAALAPGAGAVAPTPAPVVLASAGDPNSVITPGLPGSTLGGGGGPAGGGGTSGGGTGAGTGATNPGTQPGENPGPVQSVTDTLGNPLLSEVGSTVDQTVNQVVGIVCSPGTQLVNGVCQLIDDTLNNTGETVTGLIGLIGNSNNQP
jgi:hypothetical protein